MTRKRIVPKEESTQQWEQNEAGVMRKLLTESALKQQQEDERLAAEAKPIPPLPLWIDYYKVTPAQQTNYISRINTMQLDGHKEFLNS